MSVSVPWGMATFTAPELAKFPERKKRIVWLSTQARLVALAGLVAERPGPPRTRSEGVTEPGLMLSEKSMSM